MMKLIQKRSDESVQCVQCMYNKKSSNQPLITEMQQNNDLQELKQMVGQLIEGELISNSSYNL